MCDRKRFGAPAGRCAEAFLPRGGAFQRAMATICVESLRKNQPPAAPLRSSHPSPTVCEKSGLVLFYC